VSLSVVSINSIKILTYSILKHDVFSSQKVLFERCGKTKPTFLFLETTKQFVWVLNSENVELPLGTYESNFTEQSYPTTHK
jgi:hypothetical protein